MAGFHSYKYSSVKQVIQIVACRPAYYDVMEVLNWIVVQTVVALL